MITFLFRRFLTSVLVVLVSTYIMYVLVDLAIDPLQRFRLSTAPNRQMQMDNLSAQLHLDDPVTVRYLDWLKGAAGCGWGNCDLGRDWEKNQAVTHQLSVAMGTTLQLVTAATLLAVVFGVAIGVVSALRQYTTFDYVITFASFLAYSLPVFVVAVLLKEFVAIRFNDFLEDPYPARLFLHPSSGDVWSFAVTVLISVGTALIVTELSVGIRNRRALGAALTTAGIGVLLYFPMLYVWAAVDETWLLIAGLAALAAAVGAGVGVAWGGPDRRRSARTASLTALAVAAWLFVDRLLQAWYPYVTNSRVRGRPLATLGPSTPNLDGSFWVHTLDTATHLLLPSLTLVLISLAQYTRYVRASTLEVMNQDYIRTARAKGLTERTVVMRHALRNALLPLAAVVPVDVITLVGGAIITETVFGWYGMGNLFVYALEHNLQYPVMGYILVVAVFAVIANVVSDLCYALLDPRIRVRT